MYFFYGYWVCVGGCVFLGEVPSKGLVHNLLLQFFTLGSSKIKISETYFSLISWPLTKTTPAM